MTLDLDFKVVCN